MNVVDLLERKFACQDDIRVSFNIYPQLFLQEIAILFIYYLFLGLLDLIDFANEKSFTAHDRA